MKEFGADDGDIGASGGCGVRRTCWRWWKIWVTHLLILHRGRSLFFGPAREARGAFAATGDASLEEVFLRATEESGTR